MKKPILKKAYLYIFIATIVVIAIFIFTDKSKHTKKVADVNILAPYPDWIVYNGPKSASFSFAYPNNFTVKDTDNSVAIYPDKAADPDYRLVVTMIDGKLSIPADCNQLAQGVLSGSKSATLRYAKKVTLPELTGCEFGINMVKDGKKLYETTYGLTTDDKSFYLNSFAKSLGDLDVLSRVMQTFRSK
jgi:hypothetical protein